MTSTTFYVDGEEVEEERQVSLRSKCAPEMSGRRDEETRFPREV